MKKIFVTQPQLPPLADFIPYLQQIWDNKILTNNGPLHKQLEESLKDFLGVKHISLFTNATIALVTALKALSIHGEVITTPYSFVATAHSLLWNDITPVFVDIDPITLNLDHTKIELAITSKTTAILPVHCYGNPCDVDAIERIATKYHLKVIYDAAHAFGVNCHCGSILNHGDMSVVSFHATKVFNTFEGGAIICRDAETKQHVDHLKNFGFTSETSVIDTGINGKMNEMQAAIGLLQLKSYHEATEKRSKIDSLYRLLLAPIAGIHCIENAWQVNSNYSYFAILVDSDYTLSRDELYEQMKQRGIFARRYFYPLITDFPMYRTLPSAAPENLPVATEIARKIICLPIYPDLELDEVAEIASFIRDASGVLSS